MSPKLGTSADYFHLYSFHQLTKFFFLRFRIFFLFQITIIERQIFDFLGYQWASIAANLLSTLSVIVGAFGAYQSKRCYLYRVIILLVSHLPCLFITSKFRVGVKT